MKKAPGFTFHPVLSSLSSLRAEDICGDLIRFLNDIGGERISDADIARPHPLLFLVVTGGTEQTILRLWMERRKRFGREPILLLAHPNNNSLPAALEVLARIRQEQGRGRIVSVDPAHPENLGIELNRWVHHHRVFSQLREAKIGLIGAPSDWLVASTPDHSTIRDVWGPEILTYDLDEVLGQALTRTDEMAAETLTQFTDAASQIKEASKAELKDAGAVYHALRAHARSEGLAALSVRCFDLIVGQKTTACFALSRLNDEGIVAGCEGDLVSTVGMLWAHSLTGKPVWMANPARIDETANSLLLAHCTVPLSMVNGHSVRSHFESGIGVGIQGTFAGGGVTLLRLGGKGLDALWAAEGETEETGVSEHLCRTQVRVRLQEPGAASSLLHEPLGNHVLLLHGSHVRELRMWWETYIRCL